MFRATLTLCPDCGAEYLKDHAMRKRCPDCQREWAEQRKREYEAERRPPKGKADSLSILVLSCPSLPGYYEPFFPPGGRFTLDAFVPDRMAEGRRVYDCWLPGMEIQQTTTGKTYRINEQYKLEAA